MNEYEIIHSAGMNTTTSATKKPGVLFVKAVLAGLYLGVAMILSITLAALLETIHPSLAPIGYGLFFGLGIVLIAYLKAELLTGDTFTTVFPLYSGDVSLGQLLKAWGIILAGNALGIGLILYLFAISGANRDLIEPYILNSVDKKLSTPIFEVLIRAIIANFIVCITSYVKLVVKSETAKFFTIMTTIAVFVIGGLEHSIANIGTFTMAATTGTLDISQALPHTLIVLAGNIIGGAVMLGIPVYYTLKEK